MNLNNNSPELWDADTETSIEQFNNWFISFAPKTFEGIRKDVTKLVEVAFGKTDFLRNIKGLHLLIDSNIIEVLRMCCCPPLARDRLSGLAGVSRDFIEKAEANGRSSNSVYYGSSDLGKFEKIAKLFSSMLDRRLFPWISSNREPEANELSVSLAVIVDRLCSAQTNQMIRNAQEARQLDAIKNYLERRGYIDITGKGKFDLMNPGTFMFRTVVIGELPDKSNKPVNIPIDVLIKRKQDSVVDLPLMIECKSAGDFANVNKRRKEEAVKIQQLKTAFGDDVNFILFLCGYFNRQYLEYEAAEGLDWIWEHRIEDFSKCGI